MAHASGMVRLPRGGEATVHFVAKWRSTKGRAYFDISIPRDPPTLSKMTLAVRLPDGGALRDESMGRKPYLGGRLSCGSPHCDMKIEGTLTIEDLAGSDAGVSQPFREEDWGVRIDVSPDPTVGITNLTIEEIEPDAGAE